MSSIFVAGRIANFISNWQLITSDPNILNLVSNTRIKFVQIPKQDKVPYQIKFSNQEMQAIDTEISKLIEKRVIVEVQHEPEEFVSNIFVRPKSDGTYRMILDLKQLNQFVEYHHFKMDTS